MQVKFLGGSFNDQVLEVPGEQCDLPRSLRNPLNDSNELYDRRDIRRGERREVVYVLQGFQPAGIDLCCEAPISALIAHV